MVKIMATKKTGKYLHEFNVGDIVEDFTDKQKLKIKSIEYPEICCIVLNNSNDSSVKQHEIRKEHLFNTSYGGQSWVIVYEIKELEELIKATQKKIEELKKLKTENNKIKIGELYISKNHAIALCYQKDEETSYFHVAVASPLIVHNDQLAALAFKQFTNPKYNAFKEYLISFFDNKLPQ